MEESLLNFSRVEEDPFAKIPLEINVTESSLRETSSLSSALNYIFLVCEFANFFLGIAAVVSDVLIIYFIFRFKKLRKNMNLYIANFAVMNLCYFVISPVLLIVHALFAVGHPYFVHMYCYVAMVEYTFFMSSFIFVTLMSLEWTLSYVKPDLTSKCQPVLKYKYPIIYALITLVLISSAAGCLFQLELIQRILYYLMPVITVGLIGMHYVRRKKVLSKDQLKTEYALWVFTIAVACFVPIYFLDLLLSLVGAHANHTFTVIVFLCEYILSFISVPTPVYILYYLTKWDKHFKMAFDTTFKKSVRSYGADNLDDASDNEDIVDDGRQKNLQSDANGLSRAEIMVP